jgi:hypothetical protein
MSSPRRDAPGEYAREALKRGTAIENKLGTNPYKFGMMGATDSHPSLATAEATFDAMQGKEVYATTGPRRSPE